MFYEVVTVVVADVGKGFGSVECGARLSRSAPSYVDMLPKFREIAHEIVSVRDKKMQVVTKFYEPDIIVVEGRVVIDGVFVKGVLELKRSMLDVCIELAKKKDHFADVYEEYTMFCVSGYKSVQQFGRFRSHIVGLMRNEVEEMDDSVVESAFRESSLKYSSNDLVVVGWDSAVLFSDDSREFAEIIEVLIVGNIQLLKLRLLNKELESGLDDINRFLTKTSFRWLRLRQILERIIEVRARSLFELEQTKANINLLGDWYTANLYALASRKFHLDEKMAEVDKRLDALEDVYEMLSSRLNNSYMIVLEFLITALIVFEIVMAFV